MIEKRIERCTLGDPIPLVANHYCVTLKDGFTIYQYDVTVKRDIMDRKTNKVVETKEIKAKEVTKLMFEKFIEKNPNLKNKVFYDLRKGLYCMEKIPGLPLNFEITFERRNYKVEIKETDANALTVPKDCNLLTEQKAIQMLQLIFTHNMNFNYISVYRSFFSENCDKAELGFNINLWKGFYLSVRPSESGYNINFDVANAAFEESRNVVELACEYYGCSVNDLGKRLEDKRFEQYIEGRSIKTTHNNFRKKVKSLGPIPSKTYISLTKDNKKPQNAAAAAQPKGEKILLVDYYKSKGVTLKYPNLPTLFLGQDNNTPMELCVLDYKYVKKPSSDETSALIKCTAVPAQERGQTIDDLKKKTNLNEDPVLKQYNIEVQPKMMGAIGRVLPPPSLEYGQRQQLDSRNIGRNGKWDNRNKKFVETKELKIWVVLNFGKRINDNQIDEFIDALLRNGGNHGIKIAPPLDIINFGYGKRYDDAKKEIVNVINNFKNLQFIFAIFSGTTDLYKLLKSIGDQQYGITTQGIEEGTITRQRNGYDLLASNICLKINSKLGGVNFKISKAEELFRNHLQALYDGPLMVFGADVCHSTSNNNDETCESIAAVVGSIDKDCTYYPSRLRIQKQRKGKALETIIDLNIMVTELLNEYHKVNRTFPKRIVFLRDGVSEGQFTTTVPEEMNEIRLACQNINNGYKPGITYVVVQKRHHTRFFPVNPADKAGKNGNVPPGTMVDTKIVTPNLFDFFLCSHMGIQGTSKPCHYFVLHDDNDFKMNQMSLLCHYLCHIYARSTTSVSYPAPTYYADLSAERGSQLKNQNGNISLAPNELRKSVPIELHETNKTKMFYI